MATKQLYIIELDTSKDGLSGAISGYKESTCDAEFWRQKIVENPKITCFQSQVAELCGLDVKLYFQKYRVGLGQYYREGGEARCMQAMMNDSGIFSGNNGGATFLTIDPENGLAEYIVVGKAYVVCDDGRYPLSKGQLWGLQEMVNCAEDFYDMDQENMREGHRALTNWSEQYRHQKWTPHSGCGGIDIYSARVVS